MPGLQKRATQKIQVNFKVGYFTMFNYYFKKAIVMLMLT